jgi:anti-sigma factor RsiW
MLKCDEAEIDLSAYLDGELSPGDRARLEAHLVLCEKCNAVLTELENARCKLQALERRTAPAALRAQVLSAIKNLPHATAAAGVKTVSARLKTNVSESNGAASVAAAAPLAPLAASAAPAALPLRSRSMSWTGLFASCAALLLIGLMIYSVAGTLDSGAHNRDTHGGVALTPTAAAPAAPPSLDKLAVGNPAVATGDAKPSPKSGSNLDAVAGAERQKPGFAHPFAPIAQDDRPVPRPAEVADAGEVKRKMLADADKKPTPKPFRDAFKIDGAGAGNGKVALSEPPGKEGKEWKDAVAAREEARRGALSTADDDVRPRRNRAPALDSDAVKRAMDKSIYDPKLVDAELFKKEKETLAGKDVAMENGRDVSANNASVPPAAVPRPTAAPQTKPDSIDTASDRAKVAEGAPRVAAKSLPSAKLDAPATTGGSVTAAAPVAAATAPPSDASARLRNIGIQEQPSLGAQSRQQAQSIGQQNAEIFGGAMKGEGLKAKKAPPVVVLRSENVETMLDKVQAIVKSRGLIAQREVAGASEPTGVAAPKPTAPKRTPAPQIVLTVNAPVSDRDVLFDLFSLQDPKATVDAIIQRSSQAPNDYALKKAAPFDEKAAPVPLPKQMEKFDDNYTIRIEIFSK